MPSTSARTLRLLSLLQGRRWWPGPELAERLEVSERTLRRDVDRLRELGYPVLAQRGLAGGYQMGIGAELPPLLVADDEAVALTLAIQSRLAERRPAGEHPGGDDAEDDAALRALTKLVQVMPPRLRRRLEAVRSVTSHATWTAPAGASSVDHLVLTTLALACRDSERVRFEHRRSDGTESRRHVEPHRLVALGRHWYLVGYDLHRQDWRTFRLDRVHDAAGTQTPFAGRQPPFEDAGAFVQAGIRGWQGEGHRVEMVVQAAPEVVAAALARWADVTPAGEGRSRVVMVADSLDWPLFALGSLGAEFRVVSPPELAERAREWSARFARAEG